MENKSFLSLFSGERPISFGKWSYSGGDNDVMRLRSPNRGLEIPDRWVCDLRSIMRADSLESHLFATDEAQKNREPVETSTFDSSLTWFLSLGNTRPQSRSVHSETNSTRSAPTEIDETTEQPRKIIRKDRQYRVIPSKKHVKAGKDSRRPSSSDAHSSVPRLVKISMLTGIFIIITVLVATMVSRGRIIELVTRGNSAAIFDQNAYRSRKRTSATIRTSGIPAVRSTRSKQKNTTIRERHRTWRKVCSLDDGYYCHDSVIVEWMLVTKGCWWHLVFRVGLMLSNHQTSWSRSGWSWWETREESHTLTWFEEFFHSKFDWRHFGRVIHQLKLGILRTESGVNLVVKRQL